MPQPPPVRMPPPEVAPFHAAKIMRRAAAMAQAGRTIIPMHFGQPTLGPPHAAIEAAHRRLDAEALGYYESMPLKERLARHYADEYGVQVSPSRILLAPGASGGLIAAFLALFRPGDAVAVTRPGYPAYRNSLVALGMQPVEIPCSAESGFRLDPEALRRLDPAPRGLVLASPANPTGAMLDAAELAAVARVCRERGIRLISDEIYHGITYGPRATCALEVDPDAIVINSFSKLHRMPGWRLGWMVAPEDLVERFGCIVENVFLTPPTLAQHAALVAMDHPDDLRAAVEDYAINRRRLLDALPSLGIRSFTPPQGAFYLYADVGHLTQDSMGFCLELLEDTGVGLAPGIDFDTQQGHHFVRMSFAVQPALVERAIVLLGDWLRTSSRA